MLKTHTDKHCGGYTHWNSAVARFKDAHNQSDVARAIGTKPQLWINKLSTGQTGEPTVKNVIAAARATGDHTLVHGLLLELDMAGIALPKSNHKADEQALTSQALEITATAGELARDAISAQQAGRVCQQRRDNAVSKATAMMGTLALFVHTMESRFHAIPGMTVAFDTLTTTAMPGMS
ncbi:phage regulatory CII family protein [Oceanimonas sp. AH20CE76]|uniref:phage regulatory CII family protein n=1 Tax=Oceanimonas sp. AH20CE76 TaxID=2977120 RepID=UPI0031FEF248